MCEQHVYAAVTVDLMLPDMTGLDLIRVLRAQHATHKLPIVVVAACMQEERHAYVGDMANIEWLAKPIDQSRLLGALQRLIRGPSHAPTRVLHVEDDQTVHEMVRDMAGMGFNFEHATTLREARARVSLERFDVVLLDLSLPNESGWDLLPEIRRQQPGARVVILSSAELSATEAKHADAVLHKTLVTPRELMAAIDGRHWANDQPKEMP
jgi:DNA-binding response OmpR family regulator